MSRWYIVRYDGGVPVTVARCESLELHEEWMGDSYVTVTVKSAVPIDFRIGDSIMYRGEQYSILDDPNIIKKARSGSYQEGFTYDNIKLYPESARMKHIAFNDYVLPDPDAPANKIPYSSLNIFSFFAASVEDLADRIQANLNRVEPTMWYVYTPNKARSRQRGIPESDWRQHYEGEGEDVTGKTDVNVTVSGLSCWEALKLAYTSFDVSYYITGRSIIIGGTPVSTEHDFRYGKGLGLHEIERTTDESQDVVTKLYCYGSEKNIPYGYYANLGKRIRFQIKTKTEREYIARNPRLLLWVEVPYQDIKKAFNDQGMFEVELECNGNKATFRGWGDTYTYGDEKDDDTLDHETVYLNFYTHHDDSDGAAFYNSVSVGSYVYVTRGMNINKLSSDFVVIPQTYDYDAALSVNRLMLPGFPEQSLFDWVRTNGGTVLDSEKGIVGWKSWSFYASKDKKDPWIMSLRKDIEGIREGTATFDESSGNEIFPTIEGTGLDVVSWAEQMDDNGYLGDEPKESEKIFMMQPSTIPSYEIDWNDTDGEEVSISMKDGSCVGREFKMKKAQRNEDTKLWELTLERYFDSSIGRYFPYNANASGDRSLYQVMGTGNSHGTRQGNHFVALGIKLPSSYVQLAAEKLLEESLKELKKIDHHRHTYVPKVDEIYMKRQDDFIRNEYRPDHPQTKDYGTVSLHDTLRAGMQIEMSDDDLGLDHYKPYIDVLTIKEDGNNGIPTYDLVMREEKELTLQERLQSQIEGGVKEYVNLTNKGTSVYGEYISKAYEDETEYLVSFLGGLMVDGSLKSPQYKEGEWEMMKDGDEDFYVWTKKHTGEGLGVYEGADGSWHIELDYATIRKMLQTKELESLKAFFGSEDYYNPEESVLAVQGNAEFSHHLSSPEFQSGFLSGKGWAIKRVEFTNALGEEETRYTLEIDNITVRNTLRVYEMIISQLRGENDNYLFAAMAEVHHYDPETGKVWLSTDGGKIYMPFRPGDYIMVQRYQPGNTGISGKDGYVTKSYELVVVDCDSGGEVDENDDRLDWVLFKNFTTQMTHDTTDSPYYPVPAEDAGDYYHTDTEIDARRAAVEAKLRREHPSWSEIKVSDEAEKIMNADIFMTPEELIAKGDTFCRIDNESDPERKGIIGITSVGPDTPYIDVMYGRKTDPENYLKGRIGNLEGIKSEEFGWLQGFGAYLINLYGVGKFFNAQTGEAMESRIEATNERLHSVYREKGYDINEADNKVKNGFFQNGLDDWTPTDTNGTLLSHPAEMVYNKNTDRWSMAYADGNEAYMIETGGDPMLLNGLQLELQKTEKVELTTQDGIQVLHLNKAGVAQDFSVMTPNTAHKILTVDDDTFDNPETPKPEYEKATRGYWEEIIRAEIKEEHEEWNYRQIEEELAKESYQERIDDNVAEWQQINEDREMVLTEMEDEPDKLYLGIRMLPLTGGDLTVAFLANGETPNLNNSITFNCRYDSKTAWVIKRENDHPEDDEVWYFPIEIDEEPKSGRFLVSYSGECYIRFVVLQNNPIDEEQAEYETIFDQTSRRLLMQASKNQNETASLVIQSNAIGQMVTDDRYNAETQLMNILGITINEDGTYNFPEGWGDSIGDYNYGSFNIQTKNRLDTLFAKWDEKGNLIGYSQHTQTADFIRDVITASSSYSDWGKDAQILLTMFRELSDYWGDYIIWEGEITAEQQGKVRSLWNTFMNQYTKTTTACDSILDNDLVKDSAEKLYLESSLSTLRTKYASMKNRMDAFLALTPPIDTIQHSTEIDRVTYMLLDASVLADDYFGVYLEDFCSKISAISIAADKNLAANVASVTQSFADYQADLDERIQEANAGSDFVNWLSNTAWSSVQAIAIFDPATGLVKKESICTQTAELIEDAINNYGDGKFSDYQQTDNGFQSFVVCIKNDRIEFDNFEEYEGKVKSYLEDRVLNKSEYESLKALKESLNSEYEDLVSTYQKVYDQLENGTTVKTTLAGAKSTLDTKKSYLDSAIDALITLYKDNIEDSTPENKAVPIPESKKVAMENALSAFNTALVAYKKALQDADKAIAQGLVNQLKDIIDPGVLTDSDSYYNYATYRSETDRQFAQIAGKFTVDGVLRDLTWMKQTAEGLQTVAIQTANGYSDGLKTAIEKDMDDMETALDERLDLVEGSASNSATWITQNSKYVNIVAANWEDDGTIKSQSSLTVYGNGILASANNYSDGKFTELSATVDGISTKVTDAEGNISTLQQTATGLQTQVTKNKKDADDAIGYIQNTTIPNLTGRVGSLETWKGTTATWITQTDSTLSTLSARFDKDGKLVNTAGLVTGNGTFADLFAAAVTADGNIVKQADLSVYVKYDQKTNKIVSGIKLSADMLDFTADNITWKLSDTWKINNKNNDTVLKFNNGNLEIAGQVTANQTNLQATQVSVSDNILLNNTKQIKWKENDGSTIRSMITLDGSNNFVVGESTTNTGYTNKLNTYIRGKNIYFQTGEGNSGSHSATLGSNGTLTVEKINIGGATLQFVSGKGLQVSTTLYSLGGVAALGSGSSSGGGGGGGADVTINEFGVINGTKKLQLTISGQGAQADLSSMFSEYVTSGRVYALTIKVGNEQDTWSPLSGNKTMTFSGGTTGDFVTLDTAQTISGVKTNSNGSMFKTICIECSKSSGGTGEADASRGGEINRFGGHIYLQYDSAAKDVVLSYSSNSHTCIGVAPTSTTQQYKFYVSGKGYFTDALYARDGNTVVDSGNFGDYGIPIYGSAQIDGDLIPKTTDNVSLGSSSKRWKNVYGINGIFSTSLLVNDTAIPSTVVSNYAPKVYVSGKGYFTGELYSAGGNKVLNTKSVMNYCLGLQSYDSTPSGATIIDTSVNVNNIKSAGTYCCKSAASITGQPASGNYRLWHIVNSGTDNSSSQNAVQVALYTSNAKMYLRSYVSGTFGDWYEVATTGNAVTLADTQTISGAKTFTSGVTVNSLSTSNGGTLSVIGSMSTLSVSATNISNYGSDLTIQGKDSNNNYKNLSLCSGGGNVGIGTSANNSYKLYVSGDSYFKGKVYINGSNAYISKTVPATNVTLVNITSPSGLTVNGSTSWSSDIRKKNVIRNLNDVSLESIADAPIFDFKWKDQRDDLVRVGTSAQYWQNVLPNTVMDLGVSGLSLDYNAISIVSAVITARNVLGHEERIKALEAENERLRNEIEQLKAA